jgi:rSAM/selenodomain-associated transferase 1
VLKRTKDKNFKRLIFYTPQDKGKEIKKWIGSDGLEFRHQKGRDLGERLCNAFRFALGRSGARRIVAIGTDSPLIDRGVVNAAFKALETKQCVLGPALDGGYYLIGLSSIEREVFKGINWGTKNVFTQTLNKLKKAGISYSLIDSSFDVDTYDDISYLKQKLSICPERNSPGLKPISSALQRIRHSRPLK